MIEMEQQRSQGGGLRRGVGGEQYPPAERRDEEGNRGDEEVNMFGNDGMQKQQEEGRR